MDINLHEMSEEEENKHLTWSVWRIVEFVISTALNGTFLEIRHLIHILQVQHKALFDKIKLTFEGLIIIEFFRECHNSAVNNPCDPFTEVIKVYLDSTLSFLG